MDITLDITDDVGLIRFDDGKKNAFTLDGIKNLTGVFDEAAASRSAIPRAPRVFAWRSPRCATWKWKGRRKAATQHRG